MTEVALLFRGKLYPCTRILALLQGMKEGQATINDSVVKPALNQRLYKRMLNLIDTTEACKKKKRKQGKKKKLRNLQGQNNNKY